MKKGGLFYDEVVAQAVYVSQCKLAGHVQAVDGAYFNALAAEDAAGNVHLDFLFLFFELNGLGGTHLDAHLAPDAFFRLIKYLASEFFGHGNRRVNLCFAALYFLQQCRDIFWGVFHRKLVGEGLMKHLF